MHEDSVFRGHEHNVEKIILEIKLNLKRPDDLIINLGDKPEFFYFIAEGSCQVSILNLAGKETVVPNYELVKGDYFGEISILYQTRRTASVKCLNYCTFGQLKCEDFNSLSPDLKNSLKRETTKYKDSVKRLKMKLLKQIEYFDIVETENNEMFFEELQYFMEEEIYEYG